MKFGRYDPAHLPELMTWFPDAQQLRVWGGPEFRHPFTAASFREDAKVDGIDSFVLVREDGALAAFGQCYLRIERCHFGRLGVSPRERGRGLGTRLIRELADWGSSQFGTRELSLFVRHDNEAAHRLYRRLGFRDAQYPEPAMSGADSIYMVATRLHDAVDAN